jgi:hypothetical protein
VHTGLGAVSDHGLQDAVLLDRGQELRIEADVGARTLASMVS